MCLRSSIFSLHNELAHSLQLVSMRKFYFQKQLISFLHISFRYAYMIVPLFVYRMYFNLKHFSIRQKFVSYLFSFNLSGFIFLRHLKQKKKCILVINFQITLKLFFFMSKGDISLINLLHYL